VNLKEFTHELLEQLRLMILQPELAQMSLPEVTNLINNLHRALEQMKVTSIPALPLEVVVAESSQMRSDQIRKSVDQQISQPVISDVLVNGPADAPILSDLSDPPILSAKTQEILEENK